MGIIDYFIGFINKIKMNWGKKLRKQADDARKNIEKEKLRKPEELLKYAKEELTEHMNSFLGEVLEKVSNDGLKHLTWNISNPHRVCHPDICSMVINYGDKAVISAFETMGLDFSIYLLGMDCGHRGRRVKSYTISWE